jgi:beta-glucosidase
MAVKEGKVWAVMSSYNRLNGTYASENDWLLNRVLKGEWGFQGMVMSDWGAVHSSLPTALAGMDLEMPGGPFFLPETLLPLVHSGQLTAGILDDKIRRILRVEFWTEAIDGTKVSGPLNSPESDEIATEEARQGMVLLKNDKQLLPIRSNVKSIAIIGPNAEPAVVGGGGSAHTRPESSISLLQAIKDRAGSSVKVRFARAANPTIGQIVKESKFTQPIRATYFSNRQLQGAPVLVREESLISHDFSRDEQVPRSDFSARWSTTITVPVSGDYEFVAQGDDGFRVALDQRQIIDEWRDQASTSARKIVHLQAGRNYAFRAEYYQAGGDATFSVGFRRVDPDRFKEIEAAAKASDLAIVSVGLNASLESEGFDHAYSLPDDEDQMILAALRGNKQVLVIYNGGGAVDMNAWRDKVPGLLFAWYPGQSGNKALAQILFGDVSPSGKLPISVERRFSDLPAYKNYPGKGGEVVYAEGLKVGYRFFDQAPVKPAFPFGFGLSYSTFEYSNLRVSSRQATFTIKNTGRMKAAEIAQLYVQPPKGSVWRPVKELKGFARVDLRPGDSRTLSIPLDDRAFAYWDIAKHRWTVEPGTYKILIGSSSVDMKLIGELKIN